MSDITVQVCTHHSPCSANKNVVASCRTYVSPCGVVPVWDRATRKRCRTVIWRGQTFERRHQLVQFLWEWNYSHKSSISRVSHCLCGALTFAAGSLLLQNSCKAGSSSVDIWVALLSQWRLLPLMRHAVTGWWCHIVHKHSICQPTAVLFAVVGIDLLDQGPK